MVGTEGVSGRKRGPTPHAQTPHMSLVTRNRTVGYEIRGVKNNIEQVSAKTLGYGHLSSSYDDKAWGEAQKTAREGAASTELKTVCKEKVTKSTEIPCR